MLKKKKKKKKKKQVGAFHGGRKENRIRRLKREDGNSPNCPWKTLPHTVCQYARLYANVTPAAAGTAGGFGNVLGPS